MTTACAFGMVGMDDAIFKSINRCFDKSRFIESVGMDSNLHIVLISNP